MDFGAEYRKLAEIDISAMAEWVKALPEAVWSEDAGRQQVYKAHARTQTIPLIFDPDMRHSHVTIHERYYQLEAMLKPAMNAIEAWFVANPPPSVTPDARPYFARIILVRLPAGAAIGSHRDHGASLSRAHRIHLPVVTHPCNVFGIAGVIKHLAAGELWEINNRLPHAVKNEGDIDRVHLIFDFVLPGEHVADFEGPLVA